MKRLQAVLAEKKRPEAEQQAVAGGEARSPMTRPAGEQELRLEGDALGNDGTCAARAEEPV